MRIVMLCGKGESSAIVYNKLNEVFDVVQVIMEDKVPRSTFIKRRIKRLGFFRTIGQIAFMTFVLPLLKKEACDRKQEILKEYNAKNDFSVFNGSNTVNVSSVNSQECINELKQCNPDIVVVNGTRIISKEVLSCVNAIFINMHAGITPKYRGAHGVYWARYNNDMENAGVTVHLVDEGIDTGNVIYQACVGISEKDNFTTYPTIQTCVGVEYEIKAINDIINGELKTISNQLPSCLYSHPTMFQYIYHRIKYGVK